MDGNLRGRGRGGRGGTGWRGSRGGRGGGGGRGGRGGSAGGRGGRGYQHNSSHNSRSYDHDREHFTNRGRGERSHRGDRHGESHTPKVGYNTLAQNAADNVPPQTALLFSVSPAFTNLLQNTGGVLKRDWIDIMLRIINKSFLSGQETRDLKHVLSYTLLHDASSEFLTNHCVQRFVTELTSSTGIRIDSLIEALSNYLEIYNQLCNMDPTAVTALMTHLKQIDALIMYSSQNNEQLSGIMNEYREATASAVKKEKEAFETKKQLERQERSGREAVEQRPQGDFRELPVHPTKRDLYEIPQIRKNKESGGFQDVDDYLDVQFRLLREDFISTLRNGIREYKKNPNLSGPNRFRSGDVKVYDGLSIMSPCFSRDGMTYKIMFPPDHPYLSRINFRSSKKLIYGSLLCLSDDGFKETALFAVIAESDPEKIKREGFEIQFLSESQLEYERRENQKGPFLAVESSAYFESYTHVLKGMQVINSHKFPLEQYIVRCQMLIGYPAYLKSLVSTFRFISAKDSVTSQVNMTAYDSVWPEASTLGLNKSQYLAFKSALTQEISVIQGPPGTGKTYVGLKIAESILYNLYGVPGNGSELSDVQRLNLQVKKRNEGLGARRSLSQRESTDRYEMCGEQKINVPILVVCYTNHALDQFLEGILKFCPKEDVIRVGGRSQSTVLEECNLKIQSRRQDRGYELRRRFGELKGQKENFERTSNIHYVKDQMRISRSDLLFHDAAGFITENEFYDHLSMLATTIQYGGYQRRDAIHLWLGCDTYSAGAPDQSYNNDVPAGETPHGHDQTETNETVEISMEADRERERRLEGRDDGDDWHLRFVDQVEPLREEDTYIAAPATFTDDGWTKVVGKNAKRKIRTKILKELASNDKMRPEEVSYYLKLVTTQQFDITYHMEMHQRWRLYRYWLWNYQTSLAKQLKNIQQMYTQLCNKEKALRKVQDQNTLASTKVIGMTTTGAAKYQDVLQGVKPKIVIVEEAAEVLEAHITTALSESCEQLILIGDHQQLKPNPTVYELAKDYNLDLSLFERMINNKFPVVTLDTQHRMRPEVSVYLKYIYEVLHDHLSVFGREPIRGLSTPVYFFNHKSRERSDPGTMSHSNEFEADMITALTRYLLGQNYAPSEITIISMYTGQLLLLKSKMPKSEFNGVKITSVDNFQGEENTIVIVSLVRCNEKDILGFVKVENRICVALSRAKFGMYVFGDFDMFSRGSPLWKKITEEARRDGRVGSAFNLSCGKHGNKATVSSAGDFKDHAPLGGCTLICGERLKCGHKCTMFCHSTDPTHEGFKCREKCERKLENCNHPCPRLCHSTCPQCMVPKTVVLACGHKPTVACHIPDHTVKCVEPCPETLSCSHKCCKRCSEPCANPCVKLVDEVCSRCGEIKKIECHINTARLSGDSTVVYKCDTPCNTKLSCGHACQGNCYTCAESHAFCKAVCGQVQKCGHKCQGVCMECEAGDDHEKCTVTCSKQLECGHKCNTKCWYCFDLPECRPCKQKCLLQCSHQELCQKSCQEECVYLHKNISKKNQKCQRGCKHDKCQRSCTEACSHTPCDKECDRNITCRMCRKEYTCLGLCGEPCPYICPICDLNLLVSKVKDIPDIAITEGTKWIYLKDCNHSLPVSFMDVHVYSKPHGSIVLCPMPNCKKPVLNTPRYVPVTRLKKNQQNEELAKIRLEQEKQQKQQAKGMKKQRSKQPAAAAQPQAPLPRTMAEFYELSKQLKDEKLDAGLSFDPKPLPNTFGMESLQRTLRETDEATKKLKEEGERKAAARQARGAQSAGKTAAVRAHYSQDTESEESDGLTAHYPNSESDEDYF